MTRPLLPPIRTSGLCLALLAGAVLGGCATPPVATPEQVSAEQRMLAESAERIADALAKLAIIEQSSQRIYAQAITPVEIPSDLQLRVAVDYQGDVKPLVYQLAQTVGYTVQTFGRSSTVTPVNIQADDRSVGELLADVGYQAAWRCDVVVFPESRTVELRYDARRPSPKKKPRAS